MAVSTTTAKPGAPGRRLKRSRLRYDRFRRPQVAPAATVAPVSANALARRSRTEERCLSRCDVRTSTARCGFRPQQQRRLGRRDDPCAPIRITSACWERLAPRRHPAGHRQLVAVNVCHQTRKMGSEPFGHGVELAVGRIEDEGFFCRVRSRATVPRSGSRGHDLLHCQPTKRPRVSATQ
jgi:hypothetical protein